MQRNCFCCPSIVLQAVVVLTAALTLVGCGGKTVPDLVPVSGTLTVNGQPYENVMVKFVPMEEGFDGNTIASGITDKEGKFTLETPGHGPGAVPCQTKVILEEGGVPDEIRGSENEQMAAAAFMKSLSNRPIPATYRRLNDTPWQIEVTADKQDYDFDVKK